MLFWGTIISAFKKIALKEDISEILKYSSVGEIQYLIENNLTEEDKKILNEIVYGEPPKKNLERIPNPTHLNIEKFKQVKDLPFDGYDFIVDDLGVQDIKDIIGIKSEKFYSFFVKLGDAEFKEIWGMLGTFPADENVIELIYP